MAKLAATEEETMEEGDVIQEITPVEEPAIIQQAEIIKEMSNPFITSDKL